MTNMVKNFTSSMKEVASNYDALSQQLFDVANTLNAQPEFDTGGKMYSLVRVAESSTIQLRNLATRSIRPDSSPFYEAVASELGIQVTEEHDWIKITVPAILPKRSNRDNASYITHPLRNALLAFQRENPIERFDECMICIVHCYDASLGERRVRDYDNIETKRFLDVIETAFLANDSGLLCSVLQTTRIEERDRTLFFLMTPGKLPKWLEKELKIHT